MLTLSQIQNWHYRSFLVLRRISLEDLGDDLVVFLSELEWNTGVIFRGVAMLIELLVQIIELDVSNLPLGEHRWQL